MSAPVSVPREFGLETGDDARRIQSHIGELFMVLGMIDIAVGQTQMQNALDHALLRQQLGHATARTTGDRVLLQRDQDLVTRGQIQDQRLIERLDEAHVGDRGIDDLGGLQRGLDQRTEGEQGDP